MIKNKSIIYKGCYKAVFTNLLLPIFIFQAIAFIWLFGLKVVPHLIVILAFAILVIPIQHFISNFKLPFSVQTNVADSSQNIIILFISFCTVGLGALLHFLLSKNIFAILIYSLILIILNLVVWNKAIVVKNKI